MIETNLLERSPTEDPTRIAQDFLDLETESGGHFAFVLHMAGPKQVVRVEEYICDETGKLAEFAVSEEGELLTSPIEVYRLADWLGIIALCSGKPTSTELIEHVSAEIEQHELNRRHQNDIKHHHVTRYSSTASMSRYIFSD